MILDKLGLYGIDSADEKMILAGMLLGDPVLLIGEHGSAKTEIARCLAVALLEHSKVGFDLNDTHRKDYNEFGVLPEEWTQHAIYDCSKVQFEELIGFPNPTTFQSGYVNFVRSPITVWGKKIVVLDEFNRQSRRQQNSLFELIRSRTIYGRPTGTRMLFACMNPYGMEGTEILDEALVDRMGCFIYTKGFNKLDDIVREDIIQRKGPSDSPGLSEWGEFATPLDSDGLEINEDLAKIGGEIEEILTKAAVVYQTLQDEVGESYSLFVNRFLSLFLEKQSQTGGMCTISSRRASMMYRSLLAYRAIEIILSEVLFEEVGCIRDAFTNVLTRSIPIGVSESSGMLPENATVIIASIIELMESFFVPSDYITVRATLDTLHEILTTNDLVRKSALLVDYLDDNATLRSQIWNEVVSDKDLSTKRGIQSAVLSLTIANLVAYDKKILPQSIVGKLVSEYSEISRKISSAIGSFSISGEDIQHKDRITDHINKFDEFPFEKLYSSLLWKKFVDECKNTKKPITEDMVLMQEKEVDMETSRLRDLLKKMSQNTKALESSSHTDKIQKLKEEEKCQDQDVPLQV